MSDLSRASRLLLASLTHVRSKVMRSHSSVPVAPPPSLRQATGHFLRLLGLVRRYWPGLIRGLLLALVVGLLGLATPLITKMYFDNVYPGRDFALLQLLVIGSAVLGISSSLMRSLESYYTQVVGSKMSSAVELMYFNHLQHLPIRFYDEHRVGEVVSRLADVRGSLQTITRVFHILLVNGIYLLIVPPFLAALSWRLSLMALLTTPITVSVSTLTGRVVRGFIKQNAEATAELAAIQVEVLSQLRTFKVLGVEHRVFADVRAQTEDVLRSQLRKTGMTSAIGFVNAVVSAAGLAAYTWYAWTLILRGEMTLGSYVAFSAYLGYLTSPMGQVAALFADFQQTAITLGRAFEYLDVLPEQPPEHAYLPPSRIATPLRGDIRLGDVTFGYSSDCRVLRNITMAFSPGTMTVLLGQSGAGKSSLLRLICRLGDPDSGSLWIDGIPVTQIPLAELRHQVAVVWQEPSLFRGTIWHNLTFGLDRIDREAVDDAVRACLLEDVIANLPDGYETAVAEWGATLSGGQRQRFCIARALLRDAPVLLLDEATSQVDVRTEELLLREVLRRVRHKTVVFATHRVAIGSLADHICVLDNGQLVEGGSHDELSHANGLYAEMLQVAQPDASRRLRMLGVT